MKKDKRIKKRAQEEMVGFVLIILLVVVVGLVFLGYSLRHKQEPVQNAEVRSMINAMLVYTTNCSPYFPNYYSVQDLIKACYNKENCDNIDMYSCEYLNSLLKDMLEKSIDIENMSVQAYELKANFVGGKNESILWIKKGNCTGNVTLASQQIAAEQGNILVSLKFCGV